MKHHEFRGAQAIALLNNMDNRNVDEIGWRKFDLTAKNVSCFIDVVFLFGFYTNCNNDNDDDDDDDDDDDVVNKFSIIIYSIRCYGLF